ncbi:hypothetical protein BMI86_05845 [Thioclava sp. DLFJ5-1]|nr:hypothetical protein BMI86_05845 [Thioclava sp. DLFJ5-1]
MAKRREKEIKVRLTSDELAIIDRRRKAAGSATRGKFLRERCLGTPRDTQFEATEIAGHLGRLGLAVNGLAPHETDATLELAKEVRELTTAIRRWSEG